MLYGLNNNVYLVRGSINSCIYDFNTLKLYSINKELAEKIEDANRGKISVETCDAELQVVFSKLVDERILVLSESVKENHISEIRAADVGCIFAWIEISNRCNLKCRHCYNESDSHCHITMTMNDYKIVIDSLIKIGVSKVQIIGGEPFFDKKLLMDMLNYTIGKFEFIEVFTNGMLVTPEWFSYLADNNIHVALSVYSYDAEMHDKVTGCIGSWAKTNKTIEELKKHGISYRVCNVLMKDIEIGEKNNSLYELSEKKDIVRMTGRANFGLLTEELIRKKLITKKTFQDPLKKPLCRTLVAGHNCFMNKIYISANMEVFPCVMERRIQHCKVTENTGIILDDNIRNLNKDEVEECSCCEYRYACFDCRPNTLTGNLKEKPWYCTYNPKQGEWENEEKFICNLKQQWGD